MDIYPVEKSMFVNMLIIDFYPLVVTDYVGAYFDSAFEVDSSDETDDAGLVRDVECEAQGFGGLS